MKTVSLDKVSKIKLGIEGIKGVHKQIPISKDDGTPSLTNQQNHWCSSAPFPTNTSSQGFSPSVLEDCHANALSFDVHVDSNDGGKVTCQRARSGLA